MSLGDKIRKAREALDMTQRQLSQELGVSPSAIANYENNISVPRTRILIKLLSSLHIDANYLYSNKNEDVKVKDLTAEEYLMVSQIRALDEHGKILVYTIIETEYQRLLEHK